MGILLIACILIVVLVIFAVAMNYISTAGKVASAPAAVVSKSFDTDNIISSYEDFRDTWNAYKARVNQIQADKKTKPVNDEDRMMLTTELRGEEQNCRDLVARYNSNSEKANHNFFKLGGGLLPDELSMENCN
jgi:hypothetical protein